jgi:ElaB/YqjD/DUF883 family membrane-anchored ribosome-binding protein
MSEEPTSQFDQEAGVMRANIAVTQAVLADKIEALENDILDSWQTATTAIGTTINSVKSTVAETVHSVQSAVHHTTEAIGSAFDVSAITRRHPWLMMGGAVLGGLLLGSLIARSAVK